MEMVGLGVENAVDLLQDYNVVQRHQPGEREFLRVRMSGFGEARALRR